MTGVDPDEVWKVRRGTVQNELSNSLVILLLKNLIVGKELVHCVQKILDYSLSGVNCTSTLS